MSAADLIRQHLEALPEHERVERWVVESAKGSHASEWVKAGGMSVADCGYDGRSSAEYIALLASPHVAEALAELLEAIRHHEEGVADFEAIQFCRDDLEAAISREGRST